LAKVGGEKNAEETQVTLAEAEQLTSPGVTLGTVAYMSPEQALGKELDGRTDLFSFGVVLYEMATGKVPFKGESSVGTIDSILHQTAVPPRELNAKIPVDLERIINQCMEKDRELRYQHASDLLNSAYEPEHAPALEVFLDKESATDWSHFELELCLPVRRPAEMRS
jgi:serine/threonine protein kinase